MTPSDLSQNLSLSADCISLRLRRSWLRLASVFITIGPYQATGSWRGLPETSRKRTPSSPACTATSFPLSKRMSDRLSALAGGTVSSHLTPSVGTARGVDALQNLPLPEKT